MNFILLITVTLSPNSQSFLLQISQEHIVVQAIMDSSYYGRYYSVLSQLLLQGYIFVSFMYMPDLFPQR